jgi:hypothetical protein
MNVQNLFALLCVALFATFAAANCEPGFNCFQPNDSKGFQEDMSAKMRPNSNHVKTAKKDKMSHQTRAQRKSKGRSEL